MPLVLHGVKLRSYFEKVSLQSRYQVTATHTMNKLYIGNLAYGTTDESLAAYFASAGNVVSAKVAKDNMTGRSRGFGFVEMSSGEEAQKAIDTLNNTDLDGRTIRVDLARPKEDRPARPQGGGGYGNRGGNGGGFGGNRSF